MTEQKNHPPPIEDIFGGAKLNVTGVDPLLNFVEDHKGAIAGAALAVATILPNEVAHAHGLPNVMPEPSTKSPEIGYNIGATVIGAGIGFLKEYFDVEKKGENSAVQMVGNIVLGGIAGYSLSDAGQTALILGAGDQVTLHGINGAAKLVELPALIGSIWAMYKTTGPLREHAKKNIDEGKAKKNAAEANAQLQSKLLEFANAYTGANLKNQLWAVEQAAKFNVTGSQLIKIKDDPNYLATFRYESAPPERKK